QSRRLRCGGPTRARPARTGSASSVRPRAARCAAAAAGTSNPGGPAMARDEISILDGSTFLVSDRLGDIEASPDQPHGFFYRDTRFLSRWTLRANGQPLDVLSTDE